MKKALMVFGLILALAAGAWAATLPGYSNAIVNSEGVPIQATITVYAAGTTTASTIYSDAAGTEAEDNPFTTDALGRFTFYAATGIYDVQVSGTNIVTYTLEDVVLGLYGEDATVTGAITAGSVNGLAHTALSSGFSIAGGTSSKTLTVSADATIDQSLATTDEPTHAGLTLTKTETGYGGSGDSRSKKQIDQTFTVSPGGDASTNSYYGEKFTLSVPDTNTYNMASVQGNDSRVSLYGTGTAALATGIMFSLSNYATTTNTKVANFPGTNYGPVSGFFCGTETYVYNWAYNFSTGGRTGTIGTATAARLKIQNSTNFSGGTPPGAATITTANIISADITNTINGTGSTLNPTIGTANGFYLTWTNGANSTITTSRGIYFATPSNAGTWTNHYGIYLADQTVAAATLNFSLYTAGATSKVSFRGPTAIGLPTTAMTLENSQLTFSVNEATHTLTITVKYSDGTTKTATVILS